MKRAEELLERVNETITAMGVPEDQTMGMVERGDVQRALALHSGLSVEEVEAITHSLMVLLGESLVRGCSLREGAGGAVSLALLVGVFAGKDAAA